MSLLHIIATLGILGTETEFVELKKMMTHHTFAAAKCLKLPSQPNPANINNSASPVRQDQIIIQLLLFTVIHVAAHSNSTTIYCI